MSRMNMDIYWTIFIVVIFTVSCGSALTTFGKRPLSNPEVYVTTTEQSLTKVYHVYTEFTANWYRAYHYCAQNNMQLATIDSQYEYDELKKQISATKFTDDFWIGLTKLGNPTFYWFGYKKPVTFRALVSSAGCSGCSCAVVNSEREIWSANPCDALSYFICESNISD